MKKPIVLIIRDGWGETIPSNSNSVTLAKTPITNMLEETYPHIKIHADGEYVGLPKGQMGNSEVGHLNIGAGRIVYQSLTLISKSIATGEFQNNKELQECIKVAKERGSNFHILGLLSDGGVHAHIDHIIALAKEAKKEGVKNIYLHAFLDGRDTAPKCAEKYLQAIKKEGIILGSLGGRYYAMDRDKKWDREQLAYDVIVNRKGNDFSDPIAYLKKEYEEDKGDEFIIPAYNKEVEGQIKDNDVIIFANFRPDRARQISHLLVGSNLYDYTPTPNRKNNLFFATMMHYDGIECPVLFKPVHLNNLLGDVLERSGLSQMRAAETEKYPHVTFFLDGGADLQRKNEIRILVNSPKVATYDLKPEMSAPELTEKILEKIGTVDAAIINYANADMVGHSGSIPATVKAVETVDTMIGKLYDKVVKELGGIMMITADHGNAEKMLDADGITPHTAHTTNPVKVILTSKQHPFKAKFVKNIVGKLADLAPTMLKLLKLEQPAEMTGESLIE